MKYFKVVIEGGHVGAGKSYDMVRYMKGRDIGEIFLKVMSMPRVKRKGRSIAIKLIEPISYQEYLEGKKREKMDPYLLTRRPRKTA